jgi:hypothetical protein
MIHLGWKSSLWIVSLGKTFHTEENEGQQSVMFPVQAASFQRPCLLTIASLPDTQPC